MEWMDNAVCREVGTSLFFPETGDYGTVQRAKKVCAVCTVTEECLKYGLNEQHGIYGGMTVHERANLRRRIQRKEKKSA